MENLHLGKKDGNFHASQQLLAMIVCDTSRETFDCLKRERDICVQTIISKPLL